MRRNIDGWFSRNNGEIFHPLEIVDVLSSYFESPIQKYVTLEEKGHIVPTSYIDGNVESVKLFFPKQPVLRDLEDEYGLKSGTLRVKLNEIYVSNTIRLNAIGLPNKLVNKMNVDRLIWIKGDMVELGKRGERYINSRSY
jgi:hypothetical protein